MAQEKKEKKDKKDVDFVEKAEEYVRKLFKERLPESMQFHNLSHAYEVANNVGDLAENADLSDDKIEILQLAGWLHDTGFIEKYDGHESVSLELAEEFFEEVDYPEKKREEVYRLIKSTRKGHEPDDFMEELLHDADISHIGRKRFFRKGELFRIELEKNLGETYSELEWAKKQYDFLINNKFITTVGVEEYGKRRVKNIKKQRKNIVKAKKKTTRIKTGKDLGRGIDTLYRSSYRNHINLSAIADGKANMMISINTIMISVIVTLSGASLSVSKSYIIENLRFTVPILILLVGALSSVVFAVLSARPKVTEEEEVDLDEAKENEVSLVYFGNFLNIPKKRFMEYINFLKADQERLYNHLSVDLYNLGRVLKEKYRLLTISYNIFMTGLTLTVIAFIFIFVYTNAS